MKITRPEPYKIMQLQREDIPLVTRGGNQELVNTVTRELDQAELRGHVLYVRYGPMFLQRLEVTGNLLTLALPELQAHLFDEEMWEDQRSIDG